MPRASRAKGPPKLKVWSNNRHGEIKPASIHALRDIRDNAQAWLFVWEHEGTFFNSKNAFTFAADKQDLEPVLIDMFTASAILAVYNNINADNKAKFERMIKATRGQFLKVANFCLERVK